MSEQSGELIGLVSKNGKTGKLRGVRESDPYPKKICVLSEQIKNQVIPNVLYDVVLKEMTKRNGYVAVSAELILFSAKIESLVIPKVIYKVFVTFGNKTIYFDPIDGKSPSSRTLKGVLEILEARDDIKDKDMVIKDFKEQSNMLIKRLKADGYII